jgi:hypothetical protein
MSGHSGKARHRDCGEVVNAGELVAFYLPSNRELCFPAERARKFAFVTLIRKSERQEWIEQALPRSASNLSTGPATNKHFITTLNSRPLCVRRTFSCGYPQRRRRSHCKLMLPAVPKVVATP